MRILSRRELLSLVDREPNKHSVIAITEWGMRRQVADIEGKCEHLILDFNDATFEGRESCPKKTHVQEALDWAIIRDPEEIVVSCAAGISRSSAIAFLVMCQSSTPEEAARIWEPGKHQPNELILHYGVQILGEHLRPVITDYIRMDAERQGLQVEWITKYFR